MNAKTLPEVDYSILRYSNCWEDADLLLEALQPSAGSVVLSIGSAGDNSFSLLTTGAEKVVCPEQKWRIGTRWYHVQYHNSHRADLER